MNRMRREPPVGAGLAQGQRIIVRERLGAGLARYPKILSCSGVSGTLLEVSNPAGNCPENSHGCLCFMKIAGPGKIPVIILQDNFVDHPDTERARGHGETMGKAWTIHEHLTGFVIDVNFQIGVFLRYHILQEHEQITCRQDSFNIFSS